MKINCYDNKCQFKFGYSGWYSIYNCFYPGIQRVNVRLIDANIEIKKEQYK